MSFCHSRIHTYTHTHIHTYTHTHIHTYTHTHLHTYTHTHIHTYTHTHITHTTHIHAYTHRCRDAIAVHQDGGDEPMTFAETGEEGNSMTPAHIQSPANFQAPWSPGMAGDVTFSPMAATSPDGGNYGYQVCVCVSVF